MAGICLFFDASFRVVDADVSTGQDEKMTAVCSVTWYCFEWVGVWRWDRCRVDAQTDAVGGIGLEVERVLGISSPATSALPVGGVDFRLPPCLEFHHLSSPSTTAATTNTYTNNITSTNLILHRATTRIHPKPSHLHQYYMASGRDATHIRTELARPLTPEPTPPVFALEHFSRK